MYIQPYKHVYNYTEVNYDCVKSIKFGHFVWQSQGMWSSMENNNLSFRLINSLNPIFISDWDSTSSPSYSLQNPAWARLTTWSGLIRFLDFASSQCSWLGLSSFYLQYLWVPSWMKTSERWSAFLVSLKNGFQWFTNSKSGKFI